MVTWNDAQKRAIYAKDKNILISASAGAGKTSVLIARLMHLIQDQRVGVDEILAMTFSEAAAVEMKKRLAKALHESLHTSEDVEYIKQQLAALDVANISTIHGFCLTIIKEYYYMINLDKTRISNPVEESQATYLKQQALTSVLTEAYKDPNFARFSLAFTTRPENNGSLESDIIALANLANSKAEPLSFLASCQAMYQPIQRLTDVDATILHYFLDSFQVTTRLLIQLVQQTIIELDNDDIVAKKTVYEQALQALQVQDYETYRGLFMQGIKVKLPAENKAKYIKDTGDKEKSVLKLLFEEATLVEQYNAQIADITLFIEITAAYLQAYERLKQEEAVIDFNDMEQYAIQILKADAGYVATLYRDKFHSIMVDEFQDSNDVQDELIQLIAKPNNVFRVGDIKQSIYGFRHALPSIMRGLMEQQQPNDELIFLSHNYRSTQTIVDFNNMLFERLMNVDGLTSSYSEADYAQVGSVAQTEVAETITMHLLNKKAIDPSGEYTSAQLKASYLANRIQQLVQAGRYTYRDIVILVRSNATMIEIKDALDEVNIPCFYNKKQGFYHSESVESVLSFLNALVNPHDDLHFVAMLTSKIYQKDVEYLAQARLHKGEQSYAAYLAEDDSLQSFYALKAQLHTYKLSQILQVIYDLQNFYMEYTSDQEKANLDMLYEMVCAYETQEAISIYGFLDYLRAQKDIEVGEAMPIGSNDDVVRIMSIHRSKGLQFKVVLLYSSSSFSVQAKEGTMVFDEQLKVGMKYFDPQTLVKYPTITSLAIKQKQLQEYLEEEQRLLYVATTRAQEVLEVVDVGDSEEVEPYSLHEFYKLKGYTGWIRKAFAMESSPLFQYRYVEQAWENTIMPEVSSHYDFKPYQVQSRGVQFASPSDQEQVVAKPANFSLTEAVGLERGSNLHKMVECLPKAGWDDALLAQVAKNQKITLSEQDTLVLLKLREHPLFEEVLTFAQQYHEYPFMVNQNNTIVHGYMDFLAVDATRVVMIDFKSDRGVREAKLKERYQGQIEQYHKALQLLFPQCSIETYMYSFELQAMIEVLPEVV